MLTKRKKLFIEVFEESKGDFKSALQNRNNGKPTVWPRWAVKIGRFRKSGHKGVGDTIEYLLGRFGQKFQTFMKKINIDCKCKARKDFFNLMYPYNRDRHQL